ADAVGPRQDARAPTGPKGGPGRSRRRPRRGARRGRPRPPRPPRRGRRAAPPRPRPRPGAPSPADRRPGPGSPEDRRNAGPPLPEAGTAEAGEEKARRAGRAAPRGRPRGRATRRRVPAQTSRRLDGQGALAFFALCIEAGVVLVDRAVDVHGAEPGPAHRAELGGLEVLLGERGVVHGGRRLGVEGEGELLLPVEGVAGAAEL